jgi:hypothetical protein
VSYKQRKVGHKHRKKMQEKGRKEAPASQGEGPANLPKETTLKHFDLKLLSARNSGQ